MNTKLGIRILCQSKNLRLKTYAEAIGQELGVLVSDIPPAYPLEGERIVFMGLSLGSKADDAVIQFCSQLGKEKAGHVALFIDGKPGRKSEQTVIETLNSAGADIICDTYYVKSSHFGKKIANEKRLDAVNWAHKVLETVSV